MPTYAFRQSRRDFVPVALDFQSRARIAGGRIDAATTIFPRRSRGRIHCAIAIPGDHDYRRHPTEAHARNDDAVPDAACLGL